MGKKIVSTGRGGTGKSSFVALATKYLKLPLLIDLDPDQSLASMVGVDLEEKEIKTVSDVLFDLQKKSEDLSSIPLTDKLEYLLYSACIYESKDFDLISLGVKFTKGCYCHPNDILRGIIPKLAKNYAYTLIDSPAGLEHLNRKVVSNVDDLFVILDPSKKSRDNVERIQKLAEEIGISFNNFYLVGNYRFRDGLESEFQDLHGTFLGRIEYDPNVEEYNLNGRSLLELPDNSPACLSVKEILTKAGYEIKG